MASAKVTFTVDRHVAVGDQSLAAIRTGTILGEEMMINANSYLGVDKGLIPLGAATPVEGTPFDFRKPTAIGARIGSPDEQLKIAGGYDHNWILAGKNGEGRYELTEIAQPALFALQVGITVMLRRRGVVPVAVIGHSVGEVAAAWASGSLSLAAAVSVIHHRSSLQGTTKGNGAMTAANLSETKTRELVKELGLVESISIAGVNSSRSVSLAAPSPCRANSRSVVARSSSTAGDQ